MDINNVSELSIDYNELIKLRNEKRVILNPIGTLPRNNSQQNKELGLPIAIMDYQYDLVERYRREEKFGIKELAGGNIKNNQKLQISENLHKVVYEDLTINYGYYVKQGCDYGCDFLIYEKDPDTCHSSAVIHILKYSDERTDLNSKLDMQELISSIRVANKINKNLIIAVVMSNNEVEYINVSNYINNLKVIK